MPKSSIKQIELDEKKVIEELQKNAKGSIDHIAKKCGFSRQKVWRIIKRLEKDRTIWGYHAVVDDNKVGIGRYQILLKKSPKPIHDDIMNTMFEKDIIKQLEKFHVKFDYSYFTHGPFDWSLGVIAPDIIAVKKFVELLQARFPGYFSDIKILEVVFPMHKSGFDNPNIEELREFF